MTPQTRQNRSGLIGGSTGYACLPKQLMGRIWPLLRPGEKAVYPVLASHLPNVEPSQERIMKLAGLGKTATNEALGGLVAIGLAKRQRRRSHDGVILNTHYDLADMDDPTAVDAIAAKLESRRTYASDKPHVRVGEHGESMSAGAVQPCSSRRSSHVRVGEHKVLEEKQNKETQQQNVVDDFAQGQNPGVRDRLFHIGVREPSLSRLATDPLVTIPKIEATWLLTNGKRNRPGYLIRLLEAGADFPKPTTPKEFSHAFKAGRYTQVNGRDLSGCRVRWNNDGVYVDDGLFLTAGEITEAEYV